MTTIEYAITESVWIVFKTLAVVWTLAYLGAAV